MKLFVLQNFIQFLITNDRLPIHVTLNAVKQGKKPKIAKKPPKMCKNV